ncbi:hypothetical protein LTR10_007467 [Elasticomyces elasticus]|nr:hypothetical protein LTR10_007467 [Elasticomyces elasticus]KAK4979274.1 hypothetical protein LTR42_001777 [Elasticomyces elasticus]
MEISTISGAQSAARDVVAFPPGINKDPEVILRRHAKGLTSPLYLDTLLVSPPTSFSSMDIWLIHGGVGCIALILILPMGIIKLWMKNRRWWVPHWAIQSSGMLFLVITAALGLWRSSGMHHAHQALGLGVALMVLLQMVLGHANTLGSHGGTTYIRTAHSSIGFSTLLLGWITMLSGFRLASVASTPFIMFSVLSAFEVLGLIGGSFFMRWRGSGTAERATERTGESSPASELYNLVEDSEEEQDTQAYSDKTIPGRRSSTIARNTTVNP